MLGINNAASVKGVYASGDDPWSYADEVVYSFGNGGGCADSHQKLLRMASLMQREL